MKRSKINEIRKNKFRRFLRSNSSPSHFLKGVITEKIAKGVTEEEPRVQEYLESI